MLVEIISREQNDMYKNVVARSRLIPRRAVE